jgi:hypothetical protein
MMSPGYLLAASIRDRVSPYRLKDIAILGPSAPLLERRRSLRNDRNTSLAPLLSKWTSCVVTHLDTLIFYLH